MLVTDFHLDEARRLAVANRQSYASSLDNDDRKVMRLRVFIEGADTMQSARHLGASLYVKNADAVPSGAPYSPPLVHAGSSASRFRVDVVDAYNEVENRVITPYEALDYWTFVTLFEHGISTPVRVEFFLAEVDAPYSSLEFDVGYAEVSLAKVLGTPGEKLNVAVLSMEHHGPVGINAHFGIEWVYEQEAVLALEMFIKVDKEQGWPFASGRIFFIVFRKETNGHWTPIYLSEVRAKRTNHPDAEDCMMYSVAEMNMHEITGEEDCTLRIEFYQYKTNSSHHELLGHLVTSVFQLRQAKEQSDLKLRLNTFTNAELVGRSTMTKSRFTARCSMFTIHTHFGGPVDCASLFLDFRLAFKRDCFKTPQSIWLRNPFTFVRPYYEVSCGSGTRADMACPGTRIAVDEVEVVHRSIKSGRAPGSNAVKYPLAKINVERLRYNNEDSYVCISLYSSLGVRVAWVKTTLTELMELPDGSVLSVVFCFVGENNIGHVVLNRRDERKHKKRKSDVYLSLSCVLGDEYYHVLPPSSESSGEICQIPGDDSLSPSSASSRDPPPSTPGSPS